MATITAASFIGEILIPNISGSGIAEQANLAALGYFIEKYEPLFLRALLGSDLYDAYAAGIAIPSPETKWTALKGKIYVSVGTSPNDYYLSPAADYIYFYYRRDQISTTLSNAEVQSKQENATVISPYEKMVSAWNSMSASVDLIREWIEDNISDYPEYLTAEKGVLTTINTFGI